MVKMSKNKKVAVQEQHKQLMRDREMKKKQKKKAELPKRYSKGKK